MNIYPWQLSSWNEILLNKTKMPHAQIFFGHKTEEINNFVNELSKSLLCSQPDNQNFACGICQDCLWMETNHPDLKIVDFDSSIDDSSNSNLINVSSARDAIKFLELTSHQKNGKKIVVIYDAERLTISASNALLKTIEEPPNNCLIFLTVKNIANLLPTITSRCRLIYLPKPSIDTANDFLKTTSNEDLIDYLEFFNNSPIELINEKENISQINTVINELKKGEKIDLMNINASWLDNGLNWIINLLQKWSYEILLNKISQGYNYFPKYKNIINQLSLNADLKRLLMYQKTLNEIKTYAQKPVNKEINLNSAMIEYKKIFIE